jgi:DNA processing protein
MDNTPKTTAAWIALNSIVGLGPVRVNSLVDQYGSPEALLTASGMEILRQHAGSYAVKKELPSLSQLLDHGNSQVQKAAQLGIAVLTLSDPAYPSLLREIYAPPPVLFVKGRLDCFSTHCVAMVGTRKATPYGKAAATSLVNQLIGHKITIVSGLALGIDTICHQTCIQNHGMTIAVLGCGLDTIYPAVNKSLALAIETQGALVSEFDLGTKPEAYHFPRRNRIISGLSAGVCVVEAPTRSGSLITANYALQQGRDVFAVPGPIFSDQSNGTFTLIKNGATPVQSCTDIMENIQIIKLKTTSAKVKEGPLTIKRSLPLDLLSDTEKSILQHINHEPVRIDTLAEKAGKAIHDLFDVLLNLELKGLINQVAGQMFVRA